MMQVTLPNSEQIEQILSNQRQIINVLNSDKLIFGAYWDKSSNPAMTRTDAAEGLVANAGIDGELVRNDFDKMPVWGDIEEEADEYGNHFSRIPKFYIQKLSGKDFYLVRISKTRYPGFYLPWCFWDFEKNEELDYFLIGKHEGSLSEDGTKLESKPNKHPLVEKNIVEFRNYAQANGKGYQQNDIHAIDVLQALFRVEFATMDSQSIARGYVDGNYSSGHTITIASDDANRAIVSNNTASRYEPGQTFGIGPNQYSNDVTPESRLITGVESYDADNTAIYFDGDPVSTSVGDVVANRGAITGFSKDILATSGSINADDGWNPFVYRGIENPWGSVYEWVDGVNINDYQAWVTKNADDYASNVFAEPYEELGYINHDSNGRVIEMGFDAEHPYAEFPVAVGDSSTTYYADYYYRNAGKRVARFGGSWGLGSYAGLSFWSLDNSSGNRHAHSGGRLLKKSS